jgi:hypothetical protein
MGRKTMNNHIPWMPAILRAWVAIAASTLCAIAPAQSAVTISLALNSPTQLAATPTIATVTVSDSAGPIRSGMVDILDGTQKVQTLQLVSTSASGFTPGTAILRHIFAPGTHQLTAAFRATTADAAATSSAVALTVTPGAYTSTSALRYAQTIDFSVNDDYNTLSAVVVADLNNDGIPDIAAVRFQLPALAVSLADSPGHFLPPTILPITTNNGNAVNRILAADLDADGLVDLIVTAAGDDHTFFFRNNPAAPGTFLAPTELIPSQGTPIAIADFNHDGLPDVAFIQTDAIYSNPSSIIVGLNQKSAPGTFLFNSTTSSISAYDVVSLIAADMNGDGFPDLVIRCMPSSNSSTYEFIVALADPVHPGQFLAPTTYIPPTTVYSIAVQDLNHDGLPDVVVSGLGSSFTVYLGDPAHPGQLFAPQNTTIAGNQLGVYIPVVGDVDGDGIADVIATNGDNKFLIFPGKGDGTFLAPTTLLEGLTASGWWSSATILADLDGDGLNDLVTTEYYQDTAQIFLHNTQVIPPTLQTATDLDYSPPFPNIASNIPITFTVTETASSGLPTGSVDLFDTVLLPFKVIATLPLVGNTATWTTSSLPLGYHSVVAAFHGNSVYAPSQSRDQIVQILQSQSATIQLTASPNPATFGQAVTLRAALTGGYSTPTGSVTFLDSGQSIGTATLVNGVGSFTTSTLAVGSHTIQVSYSGNYPSQTSTSITVTIQSAPLPQLTVSPNPANYGSPVAIAFTVTGTTVPTGTISLLDGTATIATLTLDAAGKASTSLTTLSPGVHLLSGVYSGDTSHSAANSNTASLSIVNGPTTATLTAASQAPFAFQPIQLQAGVTSAVAVAPTLPTGRVTISTGAQTLATGAINAAGVFIAPTTLPAGTYPLAASYSGDTYFAAAVPAVAQLTVVPDTTATSLQLNPNPALQQQTVSFSVAVVSGHSTAAPSGTVTLSDGGTTVASGPVTAQGTFSAQVRGLAPGTHAMVAVYSGSANFQPSSSAPVSLVISATDYTLTTSVSQLTVQTEHHAPLTVNLQSLGGLQDTLTIACSQLPAHATCTFNQKLLALSANGTASTQLMVDTDDVLYYASRQDLAPRTRSNPGRSRPAQNLIWTAALLPLALLVRVRRLSRNLALMLAFSLVTVFCLSGCSGKYPAHTPPGTYNFTIVTTAAQSGIVHQVSVTLNVTP